jgi:ATPase subunit of ABC transporter with duplicated ATPase domains
MFILQNISYLHSDKELLFDGVSLAVEAGEKAAVIANNGAGKSVLLKIAAGKAAAHSGAVIASSTPYYVPQMLEQFDEWSVAQALGVEGKLGALSEILAGHASEADWAALDDDWGIEERCYEALSCWGLGDFPFSVKMKHLSGGQKAKVFLAGIKIHRPEIVLLDEPTNHLDFSGREMLYRFIEETPCAVLVVSHDRTLLNRLDKIYELGKHGMTAYGGNYDFYQSQKAIERQAFANTLEDRQKSLRKARETEREALERQQKQQSRGKKQQKKEGTPKSMMDKLKNDSEKSAARLKGVHADKISAIAQELSDLRKEIPDRDKIRFGFERSALHEGKILVKAVGVNFAYNEKEIWKHPLNFQIISGERIEIRGDNGAGKTTLLRLILGDLEPFCGSIFRAGNRSLYIDQEYSLLDPRRSVYEQAEAFNDSGLLEHELKIRLNRFLFPSDAWNRPCAVLSGGERMRLLLCCLTITVQSPDLIVLDEPTNNLDIQNMEILTAAVNDYRGTLVVVSHDRYFLEQIGRGRTILVTQEGIFSTSVTD